MYIAGLRLLYSPSASTLVLIIAFSSSFASHHRFSSAMSPASSLYFVSIRSKHTHMSICSPAISHQPSAHQPFSHSATAPQSATSHVRRRRGPHEYRLSTCQVDARLSAVCLSVCRLSSAVCPVSSRVECRMPPVASARGCETVGRR